MNLVVDTSVIISVLLNENSKSRLIKLTEGKELISPASLYWEIGNAFSAMFKRRRLTLEQAKEAVNQFKKIRLRIVEIDLVSAIEIADELSIYAYDAYFLACAKKYKIPLLSIDKSLLSAASLLKIKIIEV